MKQTISTDIPQSKRIIACGVDPKTADMCWEEDLYHPSNYYLYASPPFHAYETPSWSLIALLSLLPKKIVLNDKVEFECQICKCTFGYEVRYHSEEYIDPFGCLCENPIEGCVKAIEWLTKRGYKLNTIEE